MKDCFVFSKKAFEKINEFINTNPVEGLSMLLDYIEYGLYNRVSRDISMERGLFLQRNFCKRDILCADRVDKDKLISNVLCRISGVDSSNEAYNKLKGEYDKLDIIAKKKDKVYNDAIEDLRETIKMLRPTQEQREEIRNTGIDLEGLGVFFEDDTYQQM